MVGKEVNPLSVARPIGSTIIGAGESGYEMRLAPRYLDDVKLPKLSVCRFKGNVNGRPATNAQFQKLCGGTSTVSNWSRRSRRPIYPNSPSGLIQRQPSFRREKSSVAERILGQKMFVLEGLDSRCSLDVPSDEPGFA